MQINHGEKIWCDPQGRNFGVLQKPLTYPQIYKINFQAHDFQKVREDLCSMFEEACEEDFVHDVVFKVFKFMGKFLTKLIFSYVVKRLLLMAVSYFILVSNPQLKIV